MDCFMKNRLLIPAARDGIYFDTATSGPLHKRVLDVLKAFLTYRYEHGASLFDYQRWLHEVEEVRQQVADLIGAHREEIAFLPNATTGINSGAHMIPFERGEEVLVPDITFPSGSYAFQNLSSRGVKVRWIETREGALSCHHLLKEVTTKTKAISLSSVEFASGYRHDLKKIGEFCQKRGIYLLVDGTQSIGALSINVKEEGNPLLSFSPYKWLCAPMGLGIFYCSKELMEKSTPLYTGWLGVEEPFSFHRRPHIPDTGRSLEIGGLNYGPLMALGEAIKIHLAMGIEAIEARILELMNDLVQGLKRIGIQMLGPYEAPHQSSILCICLKKEMIHKVREIFEDRGIRVNYGQDRVRISIHYFNTKEDIESLLSALKSGLLR